MQVDEHKVAFFEREIDSKLLANRLTLWIFQFATEKLLHGPLFNYENIDGAV